MLVRHTALIIAAMAATLSAQNDSRGPLAGAATAVLVDGGLGPDNDAQTRFHRNGFSLGPTMPMPAIPSAPDLKSILQPYWPPDVDIDDISMGRDNVLVDASGVLAVPPSSWGVLSFSLRNGATGAPGSRIAAQATQGNVGAALFSWILPGSSLPPERIGVTERSHSREELGLGSTGVMEVDAVDFALPLGLDQNLGVSAAGEIRVEPGFGPLIGSPQEIYFTVSAGTCNLVPLNPWWSYMGSPTVPSGATIWRVVKSQPGGPWGAPHVYKPYNVLGLQSGEDIDGLAYDSVNDKLLFSMVGTGVGARDQFLFLYPVLDLVVPEPVKLPGGTAVSDSIGRAQTDDVDAICTLDPSLQTSGSPPPGGDDFGSSCGAPRLPLLGLVPSMSGSAYRRYEGLVRRFDTFLVGWPPAHGVAPGLAAVFLTSADNFDPILIGGIHVRNTANPIPGDPQQESFVIPPAPLSLSGLRFTCRWIAIDWASGELAEAWPAQVWL